MGLKTMNKNIKISVVVPIYNVDRWLPRCLTSIIGQSFTEFELLLVNDGSTDDSLEICQSFSKKDERIKIINKENGGLSDARNAGIDIAQGRYRVFVDSDDYLERNYLFNLYHNIIKTNADIAMCEYKEVTEKGKLIKKVYLNETSSAQVVSGRQIIKNIYRDKGTINIVAWNKIYKTSLFTDLRYPVGKFFEDEYMIIPIMYKTKKVCLVRNILYNYVQRSGSIMLSPLTIKKVKDINHFKLWRINFFKKNKDKELYYAAIDDYKNLILMLRQSKFADKEYFTYLQHQYRKYTLQFYPRNMKKIAKDILGSINLNFASKLKK